MCYRRGGRAAEGPALEKQYPVKNGIVGSNPTLSARWVDHLINPAGPVVAKRKSRFIGDLTIENLLNREIHEIF